MYHLSHMCLIKCSLVGKWHGSEENWERGRLSRARVGWPKVLHCRCCHHILPVSLLIARGISSLCSLCCRRHSTAPCMPSLAHAITRPGHLRPVMRDLTTCKLWLALWCKCASLGRGKRCGTRGDVCMLQERQEENRMGGHAVWV